MLRLCAKNSRLRPLTSVPPLPKASQTRRAVGEVYRAGREAFGVSGIDNGGEITPSRAD